MPHDNGDLSVGFTVVMTYEVTSPIFRGFKELVGHRTLRADHWWHEGHRPRYRTCCSVIRGRGSAWRRVKLPAAKACFCELTAYRLQTTFLQADVRDNQAIDRVAEQVVARMIPLQRFGTPEEIGHAVATLSSRVWVLSVRALAFSLV